MSYSRRKKYTKLTADESGGIDYMDIDSLRNSIMDNGRVVPARITGVSAREQRQVTAAIKIARFLALLPYCDTHKS